MGRRSLIDERRSEIVRATVECMAANGLGGTTLEQISLTAGMTRGHIRHYAGNREELLISAAKFFFLNDENFDLSKVDSVNPIELSANGDYSIETALDYLFGYFSEPSPENHAVTAFIDAAYTIPDIKVVINGFYGGIERTLAALIAARFPRATAASVDHCAYVVLTLALGNNLTGSLRPGAQRSAELRHSAETLIAAVEHAG